MLFRSFGETNDVRQSIFEGVSKLSAIARRNELYEQMVINDQLIKLNVTKNTPFGARGFFHDSEYEARKAFGPNVKLTKIDDYVRNDFKGSPVVNALQGKWTTEAIAEGFSNTSKIQNFMRGESGGDLGKTFSWLYRNFILMPKAVSQYSKTILSIPTQVKNFLANPLFSLINGTMFEDPRIIIQAAKKAGMTTQFGFRQPLTNEQYREYLRYGLAESSTIQGDLNNLLRDVKLSANGNIGTDSVLEPLVKSLGKTGQMIKKGLEFGEKVYTTSDNLFKIFNFEVEAARRAAAYAKAGIKKTEREIRDEAAEIVRNTVPN